VPLDFTVESFVPITENHTFGLACNYSPIKVSAAIFQIAYGFLELYKAQGRQFKTYGYAAYSLIVVPYILMSLVNLLAAAFQPQYPSMFIVKYEDSNVNEAKLVASSAWSEPLLGGGTADQEIGGAVGKARGTFETLIWPTHIAHVSNLYNLYE